MKFTTPCFIRKNTLELRKRLKELGYTFLPSVYNKQDIPIYTLPYLQCGTERSISYYTVKNGCIDGINCGTNEQLFLALAALRDDSDYMQWFVSERDDWQLSTTSTFKTNPKIIYHFKELKWHKATIEELIKHFKETL